MTAFWTQPTFWLGFVSGWSAFSGLLVLSVLTYRRLLARRAGHP